MTYANVVMYSSVIPSYGKKGQNKNYGEKEIKADDPANKDEVKKFFENCW